MITFAQLKPVWKYGALLALLRLNILLWCVAIGNR